MFTQNPDKVEKNKLRQILVERGHTVRSAARALNMHPTTFSYQLTAHDERAQFAQRVRSLPKRTPAKMQAANLSPVTGRTTNQKKGHRPVSDD